MEYRRGDHYGLHTRVVEVCAEASDPDSFLRVVREPPPDYDPARPTERAKGPFVVRVEAPPQTRIAWFSAGGSFTTCVGEEPPKTRNSVSWAAEEPRDFRLFYEADVPVGNDTWHYNADREVKLDTPARTLYVRYVGDPAVNAVRIYAHCVDERPVTSGLVRIKHAWSENGTPREFEIALRGPASYRVRTEAEPADEFIEFAVPSLLR
jgi:hypothetical protein